MVLVASIPPALFFLIMGCNSSRPQLEYVGSLEPELAADISSYYAIQMKQLTREQKEQKDEDSHPGKRCYVTTGHHGKHQDAGGEATSDYTLPHFDFNGSRTEGRFVWLLGL